MIFCHTAPNILDLVPNTYVPDGKWHLFALVPTIIAVSHVIAQHIRTVAEQICTNQLLKSLYRQRAVAGLECSPAHVPSDDAGLQGRRTRRKGREQTENGKDLAGVDDFSRNTP